MGNDHPQSANTRRRRKSPHPKQHDEKQCHKCGDTGHLARNCQNTNSCSRCHTKHNEGFCPLVYSQLDRPKICFSCKQTGHVQRDCPRAFVHVPHECGYCGGKHATNSCLQKKSDLFERSNKELANTVEKLRDEIETMKVSNNIEIEKKVNIQTQKIKAETIAEIKSKIDVNAEEKKLQKTVIENQSTMQYKPFPPVAGAASTEFKSNFGPVTPTHFPGPSTYQFLPPAAPSPPPPPLPLLGYNNQQYRPNFMPQNPQNFQLQQPQPIPQFRPQQQQFGYNQQQNPNQNNANNIRPQQYNHRGRGRGFHQNSNNRNQSPARNNYTSNNRNYDNRNANSDRGRQEYRGRNDYKNRHQENRRKDDGNDGRALFSGGQQKPTKSNEANNDDKAERNLDTEEENTRKKDHQGVYKGGVQKERTNTKPKGGAPFKKQGPNKKDKKSTDDSDSTSTGYETCLPQDLKKPGFRANRRKKAVDKNESGKTSSDSKDEKKQDGEQKDGTIERPLSKNNLGKNDCLMKYIGSQIPDLITAVNDGVSLYQPVEGVMLMSDPNSNEPKLIPATTLMDIIEFKVTNPNAKSFFC